MIDVLTAATTELLELETFRGGLLVLGSHVVATLALCALQYNIVTRHKFKSPKLIGSYRTYRSYSTTSDTVPAPTVLPPSRIAKRNPFSIAIGAINSMFISTLSPGITISTPVGRFATPVTSVVRK